MDDVLGFGGETLFVNTKPGRARAVCSYLHDRLIARRRGTLDAMKEGFLWAADLRPALQLFSAAELAATYLRQIWMDAEKICEALRFRESTPQKQWHEDDCWKASDVTPSLFQGIIRAWGAKPAEGGPMLRKLLVWSTGSDDLKPETEITVVPASSAEHLPSAATCSNTVRLPPLTAAEALEAKLAKALTESQFGVE